MKYILAIDLETTGLEIGWNEIIEIAALLLDKDGFIRSPYPYQTYVQPDYLDRAISRDFNAWEFTGINPGIRFLLLRK